MLFKRNTLFECKFQLRLNCLVYKQKIGTLFPFHLRYKLWADIDFIYLCYENIEGTTNIKKNPLSVKIKENAKAEQENREEKFVQNN